MPITTPAKFLDPHACCPAGKQLPQLPGQANALRCVSLNLFKTSLL